MHDMTWSLLLALTYCSEENEERAEKRLTKCWWLLNRVIVFITWLFLLLCICLKFFTIKVKISSHLRKGRYGKQQTGSLVHLISRCTKLARTSCPAKDGNSIFWLSIWLFLVLKSGRISLVHYSVWSPEMNNPEDVPFGGCIFGEPFCVDTGSESGHCFRDFANT